MAQHTHSKADKDAVSKIVNDAFNTMQTAIHEAKACETCATLDMLEIAMLNALVNCGARPADLLPALVRIATVAVKKFNADNFDLDMRGDVDFSSLFKTKG